MHALNQMAYLNQSLKDNLCTCSTQVLVVTHKKFQPNFSDLFGVNVSEITSAVIRRTNTISHKVNININV